MKIIDATPTRTAIIPTDTVYTEGAVKIIIENVVQAINNGKYTQKEPMEWL